MSTELAGHVRNPTRPAGHLARPSWMLFDWATQPFFTLITTFLFAPFFANLFMADRVAGQALWGYTLAAAGVAVALLSPVLGAMADAGGRRKPWIFACSVVFVIAQAMLWFAVPGEAGLVPLIVLALIAAVISVELATVFTNAMMPSLAGPEGQGRLSGYGWALGYIGGLVALIIFIVLIVPAPETGRTLLGLTPILPLDPETGEAQRLTGPFSAVWYILFMLPLFLFTPDLQGPRLGLMTAARSGLGELARTVSNLRGHGNIVRFLLARMLFIDGLSAIFTFGGIYAAMTFDWGATSLGVFGIILALTAGAGAVLGGWLDDRSSARAVILGALVVLIFGAAGAISVSRTHWLFVVPLPTGDAGGGLFSTPAEQIYIGFALLIGLAAGPLQASCRSFMARVAPPDKMTIFFGLLAFSGKITAFAAPLLVGIVTTATGDTRLGIATIGLFLLAGLALMLTVRGDRS
jgi:UMF1 family MFS transporter